MHIIVTGNEKGGAGKSTLAIHISMALTKMGHRVGVLDVDQGQGTISRFLTNRREWARRHNLKLGFPLQHVLQTTEARHLDEREAQDRKSWHAAVESLSPRCDFIVADAPGSDTYMSRLAHAHADTLVTPINDSFIDFDLLAEIDPETFEIIKPSRYSAMVWEARKDRSLTGKKAIDWIVLRNRLSALDAYNKRRVGANLEKLAKRIGYRYLPGLTERVIYRELFPQGLTLLDLIDENTGRKLSLSHIAARQELRDLIIGLHLPGIDGPGF